MAAEPGTDAAPASSAWLPAIQRRLRRTLLVVACTIAAGLGLAWVSNFLDSEEALKRLAARSFAPLLTQDYGTAGQRQITVVTIDDGDLKEYGLGWPVALEFHQRLIKRIAGVPPEPDPPDPLYPDSTPPPPPPAHKPKAIFLDLLFLDRRPPEQVAALKDAVCAAAARGVPLHYASYQRSDLSSNVEDMLRTARTDAGEPCAIAVQAPVEIDRLDQHQWTYPLTLVPGPQAHDRARPSRSVALTLYCRHEPEHCPQDTSEPMALMWPTGAHKTNSKILVEHDETGDVKAICRDGWHWWEAVPFHSFIPRLWHWVWGTTPPKARPLCPYNQVVPASAFKGIGFTDQQLADALDKRYVLIGLNLAGINDHVLSPVHGRLPGVHSHAVALDNLITYEGRYMGGGGFEWPWESAGGWRLNKATRFSLASLALIALCLVPYKVLQRYCLVDARRKHKGPRYSTWTWLSACFASPRRSRGQRLLVLLGLAALLLAAFLLSAAGGPVRLMFLLLLALVLWMFTRGGPLFGTHHLQGVSLRLRLGELLLYGLLSFVIVQMGLKGFRQGPLVIVEYVGLTALAGVLGWGETIEKHVRAFWRALADPDPVAAWNRHAAAEMDERLKP